MTINSLKDGFTVREIFKTVYQNKIKLFFFISFSILLMYFLQPLFQNHDAMLKFKTKETFSDGQVFSTNKYLYELQQKIVKASLTEFPACNFPTQKKKIFKMSTHVENNELQMRIYKFKDADVLNKCIDEMEKKVFKYKNELIVFDESSLRKNLIFAKKKLQKFESNELNFIPQFYQLNGQEHLSIIKEIMITSEQLTLNSLTKLETKQKVVFINDNIFRPELIPGIGIFLGIVLFIIYLLLNTLNNYIRLLRSDK